MRTPLMIAGLTVMSLLGSLPVSAHEHSENLPAGPVRDRHELMEGIGKQAKIIGNALKSGDFAPVGGAAEQIHTSAIKIAPLFPPGSADPKSRAKPEIWQDWAKFEALTKQLETNAGALATAAKNNADVPGSAQTMFGTCKSCHDQFRVPEKKEK